MPTNPPQDPQATVPTLAEDIAFVRAADRPWALELRFSVELIRRLVAAAERCERLEHVVAAAEGVSQHFDSAVRSDLLPSVIRSLAPEFIALTDALAALRSRT